MTDAGFKIQVNVKVPHDQDNYRDTLVNIRADSSEELDRLLEYIEQNGAKIGSAVAGLRAGTNVGNAIPGSQPVAPPADAASAAYQQVQQPGWGQAPPPAQAPPQWAQQPQQQAAPQGGPPAPMCAHGPMVHRSGNKNGKPWSAHFCPQPKGAQQCDPQWGR